MFALSQDRFSLSVLTAFVRFYVENSFVALRQIYNSKSGGINPERIRTYVQAYVDKTRQSKRYAAKKVAREHPDTT